MIGPYYEAAGLYYATELWRQVIPVVPGPGKVPAVSGHHGGDQRTVTADQVGQWRHLYFPDYNLGIVLPRGLLCIDVDGYEPKNGFMTMDLLTTRLGPLPPAPMCSARDDGSGKSFYRVDPDVEHWPGHLGKNTHVDVRWWGNAYVVVPPSMHHTGRPERWRRPDGSIAGEGWLPTAADVPNLPEAWAGHLQSLDGRKAAARRRGDWKRVMRQMSRAEADIALAELKAWYRRTAQPGDLNQPLHWVACRAAELVPCGMDPDRAIEHLVQLGMEYGHTERKATDTVERPFNKIIKQLNDKDCS